MKTIDTSLKVFLSDDTCKVISLKGAWGAGKTFFWRKFVKENKTLIKQRAYSYVSLFGLSDIQQVKKAIFSNFETLDKKALSAVKPLTAFLNAADIPYFKGSETASTYIENKTIQKFLICIDDLERKESELTASSIIGLISTLVEEKACKVILIYNDDKIDSDSKKYINEYREKIIDLEITFKPTVRDNLGLIWGAKIPPEIETLFCNLKINNIRVMQRVFAVRAHFTKLLRNFPHIQTAFLRNAAILTIFYHIFSDSFSLDEIASANFYSLLFKKNKDERSRLEPLQKAEYVSEDFDRVMVDFLKNGYVDFNSYDLLLREAEKKYKRYDLDTQQRKIWALYHNNFQTPQAELIEKQITFLKKHIDDLSIGTVATTVEFLYKLDNTLELDFLLDQSVEQYVNLGGKLTHHEIHMLNLPSKIISKIKKKLDAKPKDINLLKLFNALAGSNSWSPEDIKDLMPFSENDFYIWLTTENDTNLIPLIKEFLLRFGGPNEEEITSKIRSALERIRNNSTLDRMRIEYLIEQKGGRT